MIAIIDYNMGNLRSVQNAFRLLGKEVHIESSADNLAKYDKVILPGVGAFGDAMDHLKSSNLDEAIIEFSKTDRPLLGICLGMQLLFQSSCEFGHHEGLGLIDGEIKAFDTKRFDQALKVPHMGWNEVFVNGGDLFDGMSEEFYLYFVHSYHVVCDDRFVAAKSHYGYEFVSAVHKENIYGLQPHPEKSHTNGLKILENFIKL